MLTKRRSLSTEEGIDDGAISLTEIADVLRRYGKQILTSLGIAALLLILGIAVLLAVTPLRRTTTAKFRLEFTGADRGEYPNGTRFSGSDILSTPVLLKVYAANRLNDVIPFLQFKNAFFVTESNPDLEALQRLYRAKLGEPKLSAVDRARLEQEFQEKRGSIARSYYAISYAETEMFRGLPSEIRTKVLQDVLSTWADETIRSKGVVLYDLPVLSSGIFDRALFNRYHDVIALDMLRWKIRRVVRNIDELSRIPGAKVVRTARQPHTSLAEARVRLEDLIKFTIEPLVGEVLSRGLSKNPRTSIDFLESRLRFNAIELREAERRVDALKASLEMYERRAAPPTDGTATGAGATSTPVMPQVDEGFIDRMVTMSGQREDMEFRQELVRDAEIEAMKTVPLEAEEQYYRALIESLRGSASAARAANPDEIARVSNQLNEILQESIRVTDQVNELYRIISSNMNPSTVMYTLTEPAATDVESVASLRRLAITSVLVLVFTLLGAIFFSFIHARLNRGEELGEPSS